MISEKNILDLQAEIQSQFSQDSLPKVEGVLPHVVETVLNSPEIEKYLLNNAYQTFITNVLIRALKLDGANVELKLTEENYKRILSVLNSDAVCEQLANGIIHAGSLVQNMVPDWLDSEEGRRVQQEGNVLPKDHQAEVLDLNQ